jgi:4-amino-4-deoxy-L-arabinose transferase-like glycosyltransferase
VRWIRTNGEVWFGKGGNRWPHALWLILAVALLVRLLWALNVESGARTKFLFDASFYHHAARHLSMGRGYLNAELRPTAFFPPGYPLLLAVPYSLYGKQIIVASLFNAFAGSLTCLFTYAIGARAYGAKVGLVAAGILAIWPGHVYGTSATLSDTVFTCLLTGAVLCFQVLVARGASSRGLAWLGLGVLLGVTTLVRGTGLPFVGMLVLLLLIEQGVHRAAMLRTAMMAAGVALMIAPWTIRNHLVMGAPVLLATEGAWSLFNAHNALANGTQTFELNIERVRLFGADVKMGSPEAEIRLEREQMEYAIQYALTHPMHELSLVPRRIYYLHANDSWAMQWLGRWSRPFSGRPKLLRVLDPRIDAALPVIANAYYWTMLAISLAGFVLALSPARRSGLIVPTTVLYFHALHGLLFFGIPRYHLPFLPELAILAALALTQLPKARIRSPALF